MTKQIKKTGKRSLALFMTILMLMTSWVFVAPTKADAASTTYSWSLSIDNTNTADSDDHGNVHKIYVYGRPNNGTGAETIIYQNDSVSSTYFQNDNTFTASGSSSSFPTRVWVSVYLDDNFIFNRKYEGDVVLKVGSTTVISGKVSCEGKNKYVSDDVSAGGDVYPYATTRVINGSSSVYVCDSSKTETYNVSGSSDQYGVNWTADVAWTSNNTKATFSSATANSTNVTFATATADYSPTLTATFNDSNSSFGEGTATKAVSVSATHKYGNWSDYSDTQHIRYCSNCGASNTGNHSYGSYSDNGDGTKTRTCTTANCGHTQTAYITYNIAFSGTKTSGSWPATQTKTYGTNKAIPSADFARTGYTFSHWLLSGDSYTRTGTINKDYSTTSGATVTATAQWTPIKYAITWTNLKNNDGSAKADVVNQVDYDSTPTAPSTASTYNVGVDYTYTHNGWNPAITKVTGNKTYTAVYTETVHHASYTGVDAAIALAQQRQNETNYADKYTAESRGALATAVANSSNGRPLLLSQQATVDAYEQAILDAIAGLTLNTYTVQFLNEGAVIKTQYNVPWGTAATAPTPTPTKHPDAVNHYVLATDATLGCWDTNDYLNVRHDNTTNGIMTVNVVYDPEAHNFQTQILDATCAHGSGRTELCPTCSYVVSQNSTDLDPDNHEEQYIVERVKTEPTCTTAGQKANYCTACDSWLENTTTIPALGHSWNRPGTVITPPNCTDTGTIEYTCARCNTTTTDTLPVVADAHTWGNTATWTYGTPDNTTGAMTATATLKCTHNANHTKAITITVYPTANTADCENGGTWSYAPSVTFGGTTYSTTTTKPSPAFGHDYSKADPTTDALKTAADCTHAAVYYYTCTRCGDIENNDSHTFTAGGPLGHAVVAHDRVDPTCTAGGNNLYFECTRCTKFFKDAACTTETTVAAETLPANGHTTVLVPAVAATCEAPGNSAYYRCSVCGELFNDADATEATTEAEHKIDASGHDWATDQPTWTWEKTASGYNAKAIFICHNDSTHKEIVPASVSANTTPADCENDGSVIYTATATLDAITRTATKTDTLPATGHEYGAWQDNGESNHIRYCTNNPAHTETEAHDYKDIVSAAALVDATADPCVAGVEYYKTCAVCGHVSSTQKFTTQTAGHKLVEVPAKAATCTESGHDAYWQCAVCSKFFTDANASNPSATAPAAIPALGHDYDLNATPVETTGGHMYPCTRCGGYGFDNGTTDALGTVEPHNFNQQNRGNRYIAGTATDCGDTATYYYSCKCGAVGSTTFSDPGGTLNHNLTPHTAIAATCAEPGRIAYWECSRCHRLFSDANGNTEVHADQLSVPKTTTHTWGDWVVKTAATCTEAGLKQRECSVCHIVESEPIAKLNHDFSSTTYMTTNNGYHRIKCVRCDVYGDPVACTHTTSTSTAADCTHKGTTTYTCSDCGGSWTVENAYGDHQTTLVAGTAADCTTAGTKDYYKCSVCGKMFEDAAGSREYATVDALVIQPLGHALTAVEAVAATCTAGGHDTYYTCSRCSKIFRDVNGQYQMESADEANTDALGHDWGEWEITTPATCEADGSKIRECDRCHITETETIPATGHAYPDAWTIDGETGHKKVCANDATHELNEAHIWTNIVDASKKVAGTTCETGIQYYKTCSVCGYTSTTETFTVAEAGHKLVLHEATAATCGQAGNSAYYECSQCGKFFSDENATTEIAENSWVIPAKNHDWDTENPTWYWVKTDSGYDVMAVFTCGNNAEHQKSAKTAATPTETEATCTTGGSVTWTATITFEGETYTATPRTETVDALGHLLGDWTVTTEANCDHAGVETRTCQRDGCDYSETREIAQLTHKLVYVPAVAPTCTEAGSIAHYQCALCGGYFSDAAGENVLDSIVDPATGHSFTGAYRDNGDGTHSQLCANGCGTYGEGVAHSFTEENSGANYAVNGQAADCLNEGHYYYSCVCGACENDPDHTFTAGGSLGHVLHVIDAVAATCAADGHEAYWYCSRCGKYFTDNTAGTETTPADHIISHSTVAHTWGDWTEKTAPTCTTIGKDERTCAVCELVETRDVPVIAHDYTGAVVSYNNGTHAHKCVYNCGMVGPIENCTRTMKSTTAADCIHQGTTTYKCDVCGYEWTEEETGVGPHSSTPTHHDAVSATCTTAGNIEYWTCELCGKNFSDEACTTEVTDVTVAALNHAGIYSVEQQDADCTHDGVKLHFECPLCDKMFSDATAAHEVNAEDLKIPMLGHNFYGALKDNGDGTHAFKCTRCDVYGGDEAHTFNRALAIDAAKKADATCTAAATYYYSCACGAINNAEGAETFTVGNPTGHAYNSVKAGSWVWTKVGETYTVKATVVCANDAEHEAERNAVVTFTTTAPDCDSAGTRHYTATITLDDNTTATDTKDEDVPVVGHSLVETAAVTETCETAGNSKYYTCSVCHKYFSDAAGTTEIDADSWVIPAKGHDFDYANATYVWNDTLTEVVATAICKNNPSHKAVATSTEVTSTVKTPATCTVMGTTTYTAAFATPFANQTKDVQNIPTVAHTLSKTEAVEATCTVEGFDAYWTCSACGKIFSDENGDHEISGVTKALDPDNHKTLVHYAKVDATCQTAGNIEYWHCNDCGLDLVYNNAGKLVATTNTVIPAGPEHHRFTKHVSAKDPTCTQTGNVEYWECTVDGCGAKYNADKSAQLENNDATVPALGHDFTGDNGHVAADPATCLKEGNLEYWYCARCHQYFLADSITEQPVAFSATGDPKKDHTEQTVNAVPATCEAGGNKKVVYCSACDTILIIDNVVVEGNNWKYGVDKDKYELDARGHAYGAPEWTWADDYSSATATFTCANDNTHVVTKNATIATEVTSHTDGAKTVYTATVTFNDETYTDVKTVLAGNNGHTLESVTAKEATCDAAGNRAYWKCTDATCGKLFLDEHAKVETTLEEVTIAALGHKWVNPTWSWTQNGNGYSAATLTYTCANDETHAYVINAPVTDETISAADCLNDGKVRYTATATVEAKDNLTAQTVTDTKEVTIEKTGHTLSATAAKDATCEEAGNIAYWICSVCNKIFSDENARYEITAADTVIAALGHTYDYANATYNWGENDATCTASAKCVRCTATDTETVNTVYSEKVAPTCEVGGIGVFTANFTKVGFDTQTKDKILPANGHGTAVAHEGEEATCEEAGFEAYWTCSVCGKLFKAETLTAENEIANPIVIPATGHDWDYTKANVTYTWSETEPYTCTATVTCKNDGNHTKDVTGSVTITASTEADCTTDGSRTYTATFPADTSIPNDTKTATTAALGHDFSESIDRAHVVDGTHHNYKCVRCDVYGIMEGDVAKEEEAVACTFHGDWLVSENETCTTAGTEWRQCAFCSNKETQARPALTHKVFSVAAQEATCVAIGNKAYTYCERCGLLLTVDGENVESQNIKFNSAAAIALYKTEDMLNHDLTPTGAKAATCEEDGNTAYWTCERCGKIFATEAPTSNEEAIALEDTAIPATKHDFSGTVRDNNDNTHSKQCTKCDAYGIMVNGTPVKDGKEACYGGAATCTTDVVCTVCGHVYQTKLGHNYVLQSWTWNGYTAATAHYVCTRDADHTKDVEATVNKTDATVTCTTAGQNTYVATATFTDGDKTYTDTDTKTEVVNATGHNWDFENAVYSWDANQNCTVTLKCLNNEEHIYTEIGKNTTATTPATCEGTGSVKYTATFTIDSTLTSTHTETLAALGHKWGDPAWTWTGNDTDGYSATVKLVCDRVASHEATPEVTVTKDTVAPTCEKDGRTVYTATATLDGRTYKDTKITIQPAKGHDWQAPVFAWTEAENGGYSAATALIACDRDHTHDQTLNCALTTETDEATCTEGGTVTYTATVTFNGRTYTDTKTAEVTALGHKYEFVDFTWTGDDETGYTAAVANFKCANDPTHTTTAAANVTTETVDAICEADGKTTYTATATFEGEEYTDEKVVVIPMLHHDWGEISYTWVKDGDQYKVTALRVCANNPTEHQQTETVTTTSEITSSSGCETQGVRTYTAAFHAPFTTQTKLEDVAVAGHTLVHTTRVESTCTEPGNIEYWRCSVCNKIFTDKAGTADSCIGTDLAATVIPAKGHNFVMEGSGVVALDNGDGTHSFKCSRCDAYGAVIDDVQTLKADGGFVACTYGVWEITTEPTCTEKGEKKHSCTICGHSETAEVDYKSHTLYKVNAKTAYCTVAGNVEYWKCSVCGKLFTDATGATETTLEAVTIPAKGHNFTGAIHDNGDGTHSFKCSRCGTYGAVIGDVQKPLAAGGKVGHTFDKTVESRTYLCNYANCEEPLRYYNSCACGAKGSDTFEVGNALGHNMVSFAAQPETCTQVGHTEYQECSRCHYREGYSIIDDHVGHGAYNIVKNGASEDGSIKWETHYCEYGCGDYYMMNVVITSLDANGTRVPNVNVRVVNSSGKTVASGTTNGSGEFLFAEDRADRLNPGIYDIYLEYVRDGGNYNTHGTVNFADGKVTGSFGKLTPYGGNASGSIGGKPTGEFRCSMCDLNDSMKNRPVIGWFISIIHAFVHAISRIGR